MERLNQIIIEDTKFKFKTNFAGDPNNDKKYGSSTRRGVIIIPDEKLALELMDHGFNIKCTSPIEGKEKEYIPEYYVSVIANYDSPYPPKIYMVPENGRPVLLDEKTVKEVDGVSLSAKTVNVVLSPYFSQRTMKWSLYIKTMYVEQGLSTDPFASKYDNYLLDTLSRLLDEFSLEEIVHAAEEICDGNV